MRRVVVTGMGIVSSIGNNTQEVLASLREAKSGISRAGEYAERHFTPATFAYVDLNTPGNGPTGPGCNATGYTRVAPAYPQTLCVPSATNFLSRIDRSMNSGS